MTVPSQTVSSGSTVSTQPISTPTTAPAPVIAPTSGATPGGSFGACVKERESGGDYNVTNSAGYYGAYQFGYNTWVAYGGNPGDFGNASPGEQDQVFQNALNAGGESNWSSYDGC